jgi:hypothetical protein
MAGHAHQDALNKSEDSTSFQDLVRFKSGMGKNYVTRKPGLMNETLVVTLEVFIIGSVY